MGDRIIDITTHRLSPSFWESQKTLVEAFKELLRANEKPSPIDTIMYGHLKTTHPEYDYKKLLQEIVRLVGLAFSVAHNGIQKPEELLVWLDKFGDFHFISGHNRACILKALGRRALVEVTRQ